MDMLSLVKEYSLPYEFPDKVIKETKHIPTSIKWDEETISTHTRRDLRNKQIFTIDGEDAKDLDDAICVEVNEDGNYVLDVHIADVSYYVRENSELDREALLRGTSVYMMDRVIPMLPEELSNGICSLNAGVDRYTLSITMEINKAGNVVSSDIYKGIINVTERMNYTDVANVLENRDVENYTEYIPHLRIMQELANILRQKRKSKGSLDLDIPESKIILNEQGVAIDVKKYELNVANNLIEEFMLIANETIAEKFFWLEAPFIYRVHEVPDYDKIDELNKFLFNLGYKIKGDKDNIHPKSFQQVLERAKGTLEERVVSNLVLRTLKIARYENENLGHFGLASKYYCHFTSPIRRYPDLFIHRIISMYLESGYNLSENQLEKYCKLSKKDAEISSERERIAQKVERDAEDIKKAEYMQDKIGEVYTGVISSVTSFGVFVELENTVEGLIRFDDLGNDFYIYDEKNKHLIGDHTKEVLKIGNSVEIQVTEADKQLRKINFRRVTVTDQLQK